MINNVKYTLLLCQALKLNDLIYYLADSLERSVAICPACVNEYYGKAKDPNLQRKSGPFALLKK